MASRNEKGMSVPQFGGWDQKSFTDYSMVFSRARQNKKQHKTDFKRPSIDDEKEDIREKEHTNHHDAKKPKTKKAGEDLGRKRKKMRTYLHCCIKG